MKAIIKMLIIYVMRLLMRVIYIFPIKKNRIIINSYRGSQYSCNPKYISEYLINNYPGKYELIWAFNNTTQFNFLKQRGIKLVRYTSLKRFYYEATCKISINNVGSYSWLPVRKQQEHVNLWHGFAYKKVGINEIANDKLMKMTIKKSSNETTLMPSLGAVFTKDLIQGDLGYSGQVMNCGFPRNDILFKQKNGTIDVREKVTEYFNIENSTYLVLYAPTWRYDVARVPLEFDFVEAIEVLRGKYKRPVKILCRMHHLTKSNISITNNDVIDATGYSDMQELLAASDMMISDYSSCIWDFSIMEKPIYIFTNDLKDYEMHRGLHIPISEWGFPVCQSNKELMIALKNRDDQEASIDAIEHRKKFGDYEDGTACEQISNWIYKCCFE